MFPSATIPVKCLDSIWVRYTIKITTTHPIQASNPCQWRFHLYRNELQQCLWCRLLTFSSRIQKSLNEYCSQVWCHCSYPCISRPHQLIVHNQSQWSESRWCCPQELWFSGQVGGRLDIALDNLERSGYRLLAVLFPKEQNLKIWLITIKNLWKTISTYSTQDANHFEWHSHPCGKGHGRSLWRWLGQKFWSPSYVFLHLQCELFRFGWKKEAWIWTPQLICYCNDLNSDLL